MHDPEGEDGSGERRVEAAEAGDAEGRVGDLGGLDEDDLVELEALDGRGGDDREPGGGVEPVDLAAGQRPSESCVAGSGSAGGGGGGSGRGSNARWRRLAALTCSPIAAPTDLGALAPRYRRR